MIFRAEDVARTERVAALVNAAVVGPVAALAPHLAPSATTVAGGQLVLLGPGLYVNRGLALGLGVEVTTEDLEALEAASAGAGVPAEVEVAPWAHPSLLQRTAERGYRAVSFRSMLLRTLRPPPEPSPSMAPAVTVEEVDDDAALAEWQAVAAEGFGYTTLEERRISDLYVSAVHSSEETVLFIARISGRPVAVASLAVKDEVGIFGGMTTLPSVRGQGLQAELIRFRLAAAVQAGCRIAMSTAAPASASERNLLRCGFSIVGTTVTVRRSDPAERLFP